MFTFRRLVTAVLLVTAAAVFFSADLRPLERPPKIVGQPVTPKTSAFDPALAPPTSVPVQPATGIQFFSKPGAEPAWAVRYGREFWRKAAQEPALSKQPANVAGMLDRVRHAFAGDENRLDVKADTFAVQLDGRGFRFTPYIPVQGGGPEPQSGVALYAQTTAIRSGNTDLYRASPDRIDWSINGNIAQGLLSPENAIVEHYDVRKEGVAVTWLLNRKPETAGDVEVHWRLDGLRLGAVTPGGHHYYDSNGKARVKVGEAVAVDARGIRTPLRTAQAGGKLIIQVPQSVIDSAGYPLAIDPVVSAEFELDSPVIIPDSGYDNLITISSNGTERLVIWSTGRGENRAMVRGIVVQENGDVAPTEGLEFYEDILLEEDPIAAAANDQGNWFVVWYNQHPVEAQRGLSAAMIRSVDGDITMDPPFLLKTKANRPRVASHGSEWLVVWQGTSTENPLVTSISGTIINSEGVPQQPDGALIGSGPSHVLNPEACASNSGYYVAWQNDNYGNLYGTTVSTAGVPDNTSGELIASDSTQRYQFSLASAGDNWLITWTQLSDVVLNGLSNQARLIDASGTLGSLLILGDDSVMHDVYSVASNGTDYFVAWPDLRAGQWDIYGTKISAAGVVAHAHGIPICERSGDDSKVAIQGWNGQWLVVWGNGWEILSAETVDLYGAIISGAGIIQQQDGFPIASDVSRGSLYLPASGNSDWLVAWSVNGESLIADLYGAFVPLDGALTPPDDFVIGQMAISETSLAMASNGSEWLVAWEDDRTGGVTDLDIYGMLLNQNGEPISTSAIPICTRSFKQITPAIASNGSDFLVVWRDLTQVSRIVSGAVVNSSGVVQQANGFLIGNDPPSEFVLQLDVAGNSGNDWLVAWHTATGTHGRIVSPNSTVAPLSGLLSDAASAVKLSGNGDKWLAVWSEPDTIDASLILASGQVNPLHLADGNQNSPTAVAFGNDWLVAWTDERQADTDIRGAIIGSAGTVSAPDLAICTEAGDQSSVALTDSPATDAFAVWTDRRADSGGDIYGTFIGSEGTILQPGGFPITEGAVAQTEPQVETDGLRWLVSWQEGADRAFASVNEIGQPREIPSARLTDVSSTKLAAASGKFVALSDRSDRATARTVSIGALQTISFPEIPDQVYSRTPVTLAATASPSGYPVSFSVVSGPGTISGNRLTLTGAGEVVIRATQAGDASYEPACTEQSVVIFTRSQAISFSPISARNFSRTPFSISARSNTGLNVSYRVLSGPALISGNQVTMTGLGTVVVQASNSGDAGTRPASARSSFRIVDRQAPRFASRFAVNDRGNRIKITGSALDNYSVKRVKYRVKSPGGNFGKTRQLRLGGVKSKKRLTLSIPVELPGVYEVELMAIDAAGNKSKVRTLSIAHDG